MTSLQNENSLDRLLRAIAAEALFLLAFFLLSGVVQIIAYILGAITIFTALTGFCALYKIFNFSSKEKFPSPIGSIAKYLIVISLVILPTVGSYYSNFFTRKFFIEDFNRMNNYYKQTLFNTGQDKRAESADNYEKLVVEYEKFSAKYFAYHPYAIRADQKFNSDIADIKAKIAAARDQVYNGNLPDLHKKLEEVRPVFQDILKRNNFSLLAISLVDFHDAMEVVIEAANNKDAAGAIAAYVGADEKLKEVEKTANDDEIKAIRANLEVILELAKNNQVDELTKKAAELKSSFVKVYLKRG